MHIEPGIVNGAKMALGVVTAVGSLGLTAKLSYEMLRQSGAFSLIARAMICTVAVFIFFQIFPHYPVGVSEVHFIFGSTLFLLFGAAPAAIGLATGLLLQGVLFAPFDLPQYGMNVTTLIAPLALLSYVAKQIIPKNTAYIDLKYAQTLALSVTYQAGIVAWVAFWAFYGQGFTATAVSSVLAFGAAYWVVILIEPIVDLGVLYLAKTLNKNGNSAIFISRLYNAA